MNILLNGGQILKDITDAIKSFNNGNFTAFGEDIGNFVYVALLKSMKLSPTDILNFVKGILTGLRFPDMNDIL